MVKMVHFMLYMIYRNKNFFKKKKVTCVFDTGRNDTILLGRKLPFFRLDRETTYMLPYLTVKASKELSRKQKF